MKLYFSMRAQKVWDEETKHNKVQYVPRKAHSGPYAGYSSPGLAKRYRRGEDSYVVEVETDDFLPMDAPLDEQIRHAENMMLVWGTRLSALEKTAKGE